MSYTRHRMMGGSTSQAEIGKPPVFGYRHYLRPSRRRDKGRQKRRNTS